MAELFANSGDPDQAPSNLLRVSRLQWVKLYSFIPPDKRPTALMIQETHGPRLAHLSEIATYDMQMYCNIFPILSLQLMKGSPFEQFLVLKQKNVLLLFTINGHDSQWSVTIWTNAQSASTER